MAIRLKGNRKYPSIPVVTANPENHTSVLIALKESLEIGQRRTPDLMHSFISVQDLIDLGLIDIQGNTSAVVGADLSQIANIGDLTGSATGDFLRYDGTNWVNDQLNTSDITEIMVTQHEAALSIAWSQLTGVPSTFPVDQTANYSWTGSHDFAGVVTTDELFLDNAEAAFITNNARPAIYSTNALGAPSTIFEFEGHLIIQPMTSAARDIILAAGSTTPQALVRVGDPFGTPYVWLPVNGTRLEFGATANTQMYTDGTNFFFENTAGQLGFIGAAAVRFTTTTANNIEFYINSVFGWGIDGSGRHLFNNSDSEELRLGASNEFRLLYDGTDASVRVDSGDLNIKQGATTVARFDSSATAGDTRFMVYDVDNGTLERVTVGVADSGGVGFKLLRIPN